MGNQNNFIDAIYGDLPKNWELVSIGFLAQNSIADLQTGPFGTALLASEYRKVGTPVIAVKHIGINMIHHSDDIPRVDEAKHNDLKRYELQLGDILFGRKGAVDRRAIIREPEVGWLQGSDCIRLRFLTDDILPEYVSYVLGSRQHIYWIIQNAGGSTMPSLNQKILNRVPLPLPPLEEQRAIAHILGSLDDKIEANRRMNETLENTARAIFKSWFVDFDPVHAKANGETPEGMSAETADLFPDDFQESELGLIPRGWEVSTLGDLVSLDRGVSYKGKFLTDESDGAPMINLGSFGGNGVFNYEKMKYYKGDYKNRHIVFPMDIVIANTDMTQKRIILGSPAIVPSDLAYSEFIFSHHVYALRLLDCFQFLHQYIYFLLLRPEFRDRAKGFATGTTVLALPKDAIKGLPVILPPQELVLAFNRRVDALIKTQFENNKQTRTLTELRDTLLPRLISGKLRVEDVSEFVGDV